MTARRTLPESARALRIVQGYRILNTPPEPQFDVFTDLCRAMFDASWSMLGFFDGSQLWLKSITGRTTLDDPRIEVPFREVYDGGRTLSHAAPQFFCGTPIVTPEGRTIGVLAAGADGPRESLSDAKSAQLETTARSVVFALEARRRVWRTISQRRASIIAVDASDWSVIFADHETLIEQGCTRDSIRLLRLHDVLLNIPAPARGALEIMAREDDPQPLMFTAEVQGVAVPAITVNGRAMLVRDHSNAPHFVIEYKRVTGEPQRPPLYGLSPATAGSVVGDRFDIHDRMGDRCIDAVLTKIEEGRTLLRLRPAAGLGESDG